MTPTRTLPLFLLVLAILAPALALTSHASVTPLDEAPARLELKPGYYMSAYVHAEGNGIVGLADAAIQVEDSAGTDWLFGISEGDHHATGYDVVVFFTGKEPYKIGYIHRLDPSRHVFDDTFYIRLYCPGEAPPGLEPQQGYLWMEVTDRIAGQRGYYLVRDPGPGHIALEISYHTEGSGGINSKVTLGKAIKYSDCGDDYGGNVPGGGESRSGNGGKDPWSVLDKLIDKLDKIALYGVGAIVALGFLAIIARR